MGHRGKKRHASSPIEETCSPKHLRNENRELRDRVAELKEHNSKLIAHLRMELDVADELAAAERNFREKQMLREKTAHEREMAEQKEKLASAEQRVQILTSQRDAVIARAAEQELRCQLETVKTAMDVHKKDVALQKRVRIACAYLEDAMRVNE